MELNANLHLTLKQEMLKVKVAMDSAHQGDYTCEV